MTTSGARTSADIRPFHVAIPDVELDDLKERLARTRWPDRETVRDWSQGVPVENARSLVSYWEREYDWRRFESELNSLPSVPDRRSTGWTSTSSMSGPRIPTRCP